jgi:hypothetical protein
MNDSETKTQLIHIADELFITADLKEWSAMEALFVDGPIDVDIYLVPAHADVPTGAS